MSVAIGELADGLRIDLDQVPVKYAGLSGTELAISESQERMAVLIEAKDFEAFKQYAYEENLDACIVAEVSEEPRLVMTFQGKEIVNMSRAFLDTNGVRGVQDVVISEGSKTIRLSRSAPHCWTTCAKRMSPARSVWPRCSMHPSENPASSCRLAVSIS